MPVFRLKLITHVGDLLAVLTSSQGFQRVAFGPKTDISNCRFDFAPSLRGVSRGKSAATHIVDDEGLKRRRSRLPRCRTG